MSEVLTEKPADTAEPVETTTVESTTTTTETNEHGEEAHMADGTLLEEMKKAVKQSVCFFTFFLLSIKANFNLLVLVQKKKKKKKLSSISLMPTFLTTSAPIFRVLSFLC